jgi:hypothetical protein
MVTECHRNKRYVEPTDGDERFKGPARFGVGLLNAHKYVKQVEDILRPPTSSANPCVTMEACR